MAVEGNCYDIFKGGIVAFIWGEGGKVQKNYDNLHTANPQINSAWNLTE
jgi:hypothetical protein